MDRSKKERKTKVNKSDDIERKTAIDTKLDALAVNPAAFKLLWSFASLVGKNSGNTALSSLNILNEIAMNVV